MSAAVGLGRLTPVGDWVGGEHGFCARFCAVVVRCWASLKGSGVELMFRCLEAKKMRWWCLQPSSGLDAVEQRGGRPSVAGGGCALTGEGGLGAAGD